MLLLRLVVCPLFSGKFLRNVTFSSAQGSIVSIQFAELLVLCDHVFGHLAQLFPETQDFLLKALNIARCFFAFLPLQPCPHGHSSFAMGLVPFGQGPIVAYDPGVVPGIHLFPSMYTAIISKAVLPLHQLLMWPSLLLGRRWWWWCSPVASGLRIVGHFPFHISRQFLPFLTWFPWKPIFSLFFTQVRRALIIVAGCPV